MNALMEQWCDAPEQGIELTCSRMYKSNDQAWVEQTNGMLIRPVVGHERLVGLEAVQLLAQLYVALRLFTNLFQPSFKLKCCVREGGCTTCPEHRCSSSWALDCSAIRRPRAAGS